MRRVVIVGTLGALLSGLLPIGAARATGLTITPVRAIGQPGYAELYPWGAATMPDGSVLIGDYWGQRIQHYATDGTSLGTIVPKAATHSFPYGIGTDPRNGDIYFGDVDKQATVDKYDASGNFLYEFGAKGTGPNKFLYPSRVAVISDGVVYVADSNDATISAHDPATGQELFSFKGSGAGALNTPRGMDVDAADRIYVLDAYTRKVQVFERDGTWLYGFGSGLLAGDLRGLAVDRVNGWVYVVAAATGKIFKFTLSGTYLTTFTGFGGGREVTVDGDGNLWVSDLGGFQAKKLSPTGQLLLSVPNPPSPPPPGGFVEPRSVAVDATGNIAVADTKNWRIQIFNPDGTFLRQWGTRGAGPTGFNYPKGIAYDRADGSVLVADTDNQRIKKYTATGTFLWEASGFKGPVGIDARAGKVYVADTLNARVKVLDSSTGAASLTFGVRGNGAGQLQQPTGITVDPDGSMWVADATRGLVQHFSAAGAYLGAIGSPGAGDDHLSQPWDVARFGSYVFVSDASTQKIKVWTTDGTFVIAFGGYGTALGSFRGPRGIDISDDGHLYVSEQLGERVQEFQIGTG